MGEEAYVAFHGNVYMKGCSDSHRSGMLIQFVLEHEEDYKAFKEFKKHRKGKAGTGLYNALSKGVNKGYKKWYGPVELRFLRWAISSVHGAVVTFQTLDEKEWRRMREKSNAIDEGYTLDQLDATELILIELDQEGKPINVKQRAKLEKQQRERSWGKGGPQSKRAARLCKEDDCRMWVTARAQDPGAAPTVVQVFDWHQVAKWMRKECDIDSRAQLDHDPAALQRFEDRVMKPYLRSTM
jgi:hypothetical protein